MDKDRQKTGWEPLGIAKKLEVAIQLWATWKANNSPQIHQKIRKARSQAKLLPLPLKN